MGRPPRPSNAVLSLFFRWGFAKSVRHRFLEPAFAGSSPAPPASADLPARWGRDSQSEHRDPKQIQIPRIEPLAHPRPFCGRAMGPTPTGARGRESPTESVSVGKPLRENGAGVSYCGVSRGGPVGRFLFPRAEWKNVPSSSSGPSLFPVRWFPFRVWARMLPGSAARFPAARPGGPSLDRGLFRPQPGAPAAPKRRPARAEAGFASAERDHDQVGPSGTDDRRLVACVSPQGPDRILRRLASFRAVGA